MPSRPRNRSRRAGGAGTAAKSAVAPPAADADAAAVGAADEFGSATDENAPPPLAYSGPKQQQHQPVRAERGDGPVPRACAEACSTPKAACSTPKAEATTSAPRPVDEAATTSTSTPSSSSLLPDLVAPPPPPSQLTPLVDMASSAAQLERRVARALSLEVAELRGEELRGENWVPFFLSLSIGANEENLDPQPPPRFC